MATSLRIALLNCDTPVPNVLAERGLYSDLFAELLRNTASKTPELSGLELDFKAFDSVKGEEPTGEELAQLDAIVISGAAAAAYDKAPWIDSLIAFCRSNETPLIPAQHSRTDHEAGVYILYPSIKLFGACFGHQILCHALFSAPGQNIVSAEGWELGVCAVDLSPAFLSNFGPVTSNKKNPKQMRQQFVHLDHVALSALPRGFHSIGRTKRCAVEGVWKKGRLLTFQGHAEFDRMVNRETVMVFGYKKWGNDFLREALDAVERDDDSIWAASVMLRFFLEEADAERSERFSRNVTSSSSGEDLRIRARL
ncbi:hypothetical protein HYFRA_00002343 [Hymenoscyphus fraxineus]|uniref:Class I glutamine amidotransferase-like protein n=1 Tax=Hymenoscyphus fraxineus TaxID=746836 RepID=A0A9N9L647_9HELO|nr:hypothetical protein HYFRA_00002343 [Hymenoscyphus fraxineus]